MVEVQCCDLPAGTSLSIFFQVLSGRFPGGEKLPRPDFLLGAGHATHWSLLAAKRAYGGRSIVLMRPSLPFSWFDDCVIPEHDQPPSGERIIPTKGVLNPLTFYPDKDRAKGLILIGGESRHYRWGDRILVQQLEALLDQQCKVNWCLTTSRRTPNSTLEILKAMMRPNLEIVPHTRTPRDWVPRHLKDAGQVWVTPDSVSMLYEAMTACDRVGVLKISDQAGSTRVARGVSAMIASGRLFVIDDASEQVDWAAHGQQPLAEADRVARVLLSKYKSKN